MSNYDTYLTTLRRVPDDIVRAVAPRRIEPMSIERCLAGWLAREAVSRTWWNRLWRRRAEDVSICGVRETCSAKFGGSYNDWHGIFVGIVANEHAVRSAWYDRIGMARERAA